VKPGCPKAGLHIPLLVLWACGTVEHPDRVKSLSLSSHPRLLPTRAGPAVRMPLPLCYFPNVLVAMPAERCLPSVDLWVGSVSNHVAVSRKEFEAVEAWVGGLTSGSKFSNVTGAAGSGRQHLVTVFVVKALPVRLSQR